MKHVSLALVAFFVTGSTVLAGTHGSLSRSDIADLLSSKQPQLQRALAAFDLACVGDARMINRVENVKLNGARIGPYDFPAKPKGTPQPFCFTVHIETRATFIDAAGKTVPLSKATDFREEVTSVSVRPEPADKCFTQRSDQCD
jgi:hypothetical protein